MFNFCCSVIDVPLIICISNHDDEYSEYNESYEYYEYYCEDYEY